MAQPGTSAKRLSPKPAISDCSAKLVSLTRADQHNPQLQQISPHIMKASAILALSTAALAAASTSPKGGQIVLQDPQPTIVEPDEYLIELSPGETRYVTEDEKWALRRVRLFELAEIRLFPLRRDLLFCS